MDYTFKVFSYASIKLFSSTFFIHALCWLSSDNIIDLPKYKTYYSGNRKYAGFSTIVHKLETYFSTFQNRICRENFESAENYESFQLRPVLGKIGGIFFFCPTAAYLFISIPTYMLYKKVSSERNTYNYLTSQLASRVTFHEHLLPVCLPSPNRELEPGTTCTVIGWGKKDESGSKYNVTVCIKRK